MSRKIFAVYGASGCGREVMPFAREQLAGLEANQLVFIDDDPLLDYANGHKVFRYNEFVGMDAEERFAAIAIADSRVRQRLAKQLRKDKVKLWQVVAANVIIMDNVVLGEGAIISPFVTIGSNAEIGVCFQANISSYIAHDCQIGDFVTFAPGVKCNGNVKIGDYAYIGTGAIIRQGRPGKPLSIGEGATVGMGSIVTKDVPAGATVFGNPAVPKEG